MGEPLLRVEGVRKCYRRGQTQQRMVLDSVSFTVSAGEIVAVDAERRAGKTTLLRVIAGMEDQDAGSVSFEGKTLSAEARHRLLGSQIGWADRRGPRMPWRVIDYVSLPLTVNAGRRALASARERGLAALERVGAARCAAQQWDELADYEQMLVSLARLFAQRPRLVVADDLFDDLRARGRAEAADLLASIVEDLGCGVVASVSSAETALLADCVLLLCDGSVRAMSDQVTPEGGKVISFPGWRGAAGAGQ